ncbi:MAG: UDP-N-acetylglucosamine 2-epimerase (non-hydrolyzing) [Methanoregula sp.]|nr:UDP-N-acetylglucosamine 2-epimerase (non-hydrolyzing) [Methanoregula sp.]
MKIAIILGTRPEIIKMSPIIRYLNKKQENFFILHTGQHYSYEMDKTFFDTLELPAPKYNLDVGSASHAIQSGKIMMGVEEVFQKEKPDVVLVQGDTNTVMAGAIAASKLHIKVGHVEAGLRSHDRSMPEEINRIIADHISDYLFAPTKLAKDNLLDEGIDQNKIFITGNTIVDAILQNLKIAQKSGNILKTLNLVHKNYFLVTVHRAENVDDKERLKKIIMGLCAIQKKYSLPIIFPIHPRTNKRIAEFGIDLEGITIIPPQGFLEFLQLEDNAKLILTDSGGVQEEACILGVPCVTLRDNTERPETVDVHANILSGVEPDLILRSTENMLESETIWKNPFGDGKASQMIIRTLIRAFQGSHSPDDSTA